jgi:hypothetical protein
MKLVWMAAAAVIMAGCSAEIEAESSDAVPAIEVSEVTPSAKKGGGGLGTTKKDDLLKDGYTCSELEGTTLTLCWKGSTTYSCDSNGNCIQMHTQPQPPVTRPIVVAPIATVVAP